MASRRRRVVQGPPKPFDVQLVGVSVHEIRTGRRKRRRTDQERPVVESWLQPHSGAANDDGVFTVIAGVDVTYAVGDQAATIRCGVVGLFRHEAEVAPELLARFQHREAMILLWPYVRAAVGEIGHMMDLGLPPLPTLDVLALIDAAESEEQIDSAAVQAHTKLRKSSRKRSAPDG